MAPRSSRSQTEQHCREVARDPQVDLPELQPDAPWREWIAPAALAFAAWCLVGFHVGERGMWSSHEGRAAQNAQTILNDGCWLVPRLYTGEPELQKPPLYYWIVAVTAWLEDGRVEAINVRLPAALSAVLGALLVYSLGRSMWGRETGLWAAIILLTTTRFAWLGRVGRIDQPLCLVAVASLAIVWKWFQDSTSERPGGRRAVHKPLGFGLYALLAVGVLLKGPVAVLLVMLPALVFLALAGIPVVPRLQPGWRDGWRELRLLPGFALTAALAAPWFVAATIATRGEFFTSFFLYHNVERALGTTEALKAGPVWYYVPRLLTDAFPWSLLYPAMWLWLAKCRDRWLPARSRPDRPAAAVDYRCLFLVVWALVQFLFLSLVSFKRADYLLPVFPAMALLTAAWLGERTREALRAWSRKPQQTHRRWRRIVLASAALSAFLTAPLLAWGGVEFQKKGVMRSLVKIDVLRDHLNETDLFMLDHVERLMRENWPLLVIGGIVIVGSVWLLHTGWHQGGPRRILVAMAAPWLVFFTLQVHVLLPALDPVREMSRFAKTIRAVAGDATVHYFGKFDSDLAFHVGRPAKDLQVWDQIVALDAQSEPAFVVLKADQLPWIRKDPHLARWAVVVDNRELSFDGHRDHRVLITSKPAAVAHRLDAVRSSR